MSEQSRETPILLPYERTAVSNLKILTAKKLRDLRHVLVVECHSEPVAVIVPADWYSQTVDLIQQVAGRTR